jgi:hypothetical protein
MGGMIVANPLDCRTDWIGGKSMPVNNLTMPLIVRTSHGCQAWNRQHGTLSWAYAGLDVEFGELRDDPGHVRRLRGLFWRTGLRQAPILGYLARYTHMSPSPTAVSAVANRRLVSLGDNRVTFRWND